MDKNMKIRLGIGALVLLAVLGFIYFYQNKTDSLGGSEKASNDALRIISDPSRREMEEDLAKLEAQVQNEPEDPEDRYDLYLRLARARFDLGRNIDALAALDQIVDERGDFANPGRVWFMYANIYHESGDIDRAMTSIRNSVEADSDEEDYWLTYIGISQQKDPDLDLNSIYNEALEKTGNSVDIITAYARYLEYTLLKQKAVEMWQKAIEVDPGDKAEYELEIQRIQSQPTQ